jgi:hypothetical protein
LLHGATGDCSYFPNAVMTFVLKVKYTQSIFC